MRLADVLAEHQPADAQEAADLVRLRSLVEAVDDPWSRSLALHLTASALVVDPASRRVLLRWHAKQERWLQVGGHGDPGETDPWLIASREADEETALPDLRPHPGPEPVLADLAIVQVHAAGDEPAHEHGDLRYLLATDRPESLPSVVEGVALRWFSVEEALEVADRWLERLLRRAASTL